MTTGRPATRRQPAGQLHAAVAVDVGEHRAPALPRSTRASSCAVPRVLVWPVWNSTLWPASAAIRARSGSARSRPPTIPMCMDRSVVRYNGCVNGRRQTREPRCSAQVVTVGRSRRIAYGNPALAVEAQPAEERIEQIGRRAMAAAARGDGALARRRAAASRRAASVRTDAQPLQRMRGEHGVHVDAEGAAARLSPVLEHAAGPGGVPLLRGDGDACESRARARSQREVHVLVGVQRVGLEPDALGRHAERGHAGGDRLGLDVARVHGAARGDEGAGEAALPQDRAPGGAAHLAQRERAVVLRRAAGDDDGVEARGGGRAHLVVRGAAADGDDRRRAKRARARTPSA